MDSPHAVYKWELETLITRLLTTGKLKGRPGRPVYSLQCGKFGIVPKLVNTLRSLEGAEAGQYLDGGNVMNEMHRIAHRTFAWQRGFLSRRAIYRSSFIFGHDECAAQFRERYGISIERFMLCGYLLTGMFLDGPTVAATHPGAGPELIRPTEEEWRKSVAMLSLPISEARLKASRLIAGANTQRVRLPVAFQPSILRLWPILSFGNGDERLRAPLFQLVGNRVTSGLYYDVVPGSASTRNEVGDRFERYARELLEASLPGIDLTPSYRFRLGGNEAATPDILIRRGGELALVVECKATKLTLAAQYRDEPFQDKGNRYDEMVKAVRQTWRFFSLARRGIAGRDRIAADAKGVVLTLDAWMTMSDSLQTAVLTEAGRLSDADPTILPEDRRPVMFTNVADLEFLVARVDEEGFFRTIDRACQPDRIGWMVTTIPEEIDAALPEQKPYPFDPGERLAWMVRNPGQ